MEIKVPTASVGVICARFQVHELHEAHKELIDTVLSRHAKVFIFLGLSSVKGSINDPLDFQPRKQMLLEAYPPSDPRYANLTIHYIKDQVSDEKWSKTLDGQIRDMLSPSDTVILYGSRDSFLKYYSGKFQTLELEATRNISGSEVRAKLAAAPQSHPMFRAGAIWASSQRFPTVYSTTDVLVFNHKDRKILLGRKPNETFYRLPGGFVDINDDSFEAAAMRELVEETHLTVGKDGLFYVGSQKVDDWRYRSNPSEKIMTHIFVGLYSHGAATAGDDLAEVRWFQYDGFDPEAFLVSEHKEIFKKTKNFIDEKFPKS